MKENYKIGFDIGGVLSKYPEMFSAMIDAFSNSNRWEVYYITDMDRETAEEVLEANKIDYQKDRLICADWNMHEGMCKAREAKLHSLDVLVDDHLEYLSSEDIPVGLLVVPRPSKPYHAPGWKTEKESE